MKVVVVESPAKAKTINKYLGKDYSVLASFGHVRDLPSKDGSVDPDKDFAMKWAVDRDSTKRLNEIAKALKSADHLILATDPDREGEAISWHILEVLQAKKALSGVEVERVVFNEITASAVRAAMAEPREINQELVDAYLARRALDYLVGFTLSPVLWRKLPGARSAGRVQSVALRIVCDRELEIDKFETEEYWQITGAFEAESGGKFDAKLRLLGGEKLKKFSLPNEDSARRALEAALAEIYSIGEVQKRPTKRNPQPPFTTSTLQQEAARKLGFSAQHTMRVAQGLYEGKTVDGEVTGLITYMRTDGVSIAGEAISACRKVIGSDFGAKYVPASPRAYKARSKNAQEAHEAIRPTSVARKPQAIAAALNEDERRLYELIWKRTIASQMASAEVEQTRIDIASGSGEISFRATGSVIRFDGFLKLYQEGKDDNGGAKNGDKRLPQVSEKTAVDLTEARPSQHFTEPPPRYSEASLVRKLEELGIGRPSTYASTLSVLRQRNYVRMEKARFIPEDKGRIVTAFLERFFARYVEYGFTAGLEEQLDQVSAGNGDWKEVLRAFWTDFKEKTDEVLGVRNSVILEDLNEFLGPFLFHPTEDGADPRDCKSCEGGRLSLKVGKFGAFIGCSNYPDCSFTRPFGNSQKGEADAAQGDGIKVIGDHPETGTPITLRSGRFGPYVQVGEAEGKTKPARASIPKDVDSGDVDLEMAVALLSLPREVGAHPETGAMITASIGRYGPYLLHDGKYASLTDTKEVFEVGINRAVTLIADAKKKGAAKGSSVLKQLGAHPDDKKPVNVMSGRYGPYVKHGKINATIPSGTDPESVTLDAAILLIAEKAAKGPTKRKRRKSSG